MSFVLVKLNNFWKKKPSNIIKCYKAGSMQGFMNVKEHLEMLIFKDISIKSSVHQMIFKELLEMLMFVESVEIIRVAPFPYRSDKVILPYLFYLTPNSVKLNYKTSKHSTMVGVVRPKYPLSLFFLREKKLS